MGAEHGRGFMGTGECAGAGLLRAASPLRQWTAHSMLVALLDVLLGLLLSWTSFLLCCRGRNEMTSRRLHDPSHWAERAAEAKLAAARVLMAPALNWRALRMHKKKPARTYREG
jgi:hypothetical protein